MNLFKRNLFFACLLLAGTAQAQLEVAHLRTRNFRGTGFGAFPNVSFPLSSGAALTGEAAVYIVKNENRNVALVPFMAGYRHSLDGTGTGFYLEPRAGYSIGATDIQRIDENGNPVADRDGNEEQNARGITAGLITGYILKGSVPLNFGLQYQQVFSSGVDPALHLLSLRFMYPLSLRKRD